jgi:hypothetical protein
VSLQDPELDSDPKLMNPEHPNPDRLFQIVTKPSQKLGQVYSTGKYHNQIQPLKGTESFWDTEKLFRI